MIKLDNVSKYYYSKGIVASGISKVSLELEIGEFVAITGESGSGKSTLLNVISGLDSYEDGEMYINNEETSHYSEKDYEDYRRKYIGNIFQNFNLINSYTVYQNIELVLLLNGENKKDIVNKIDDIIKEVNMTKFRNTKVSKLSGGQKQRVAIARALAKDTPILIADEPTGNLDSKAAKDVLELLHNISKNKLVVIVTHNYDTVEKYVTRKIRMYDGKILENKVITKCEKVSVELAKHDEITFLNKIILIFRNTFNVVPKFLLLLFIFFFLVIAVTSKYAFDRKQEYDLEYSGYNYHFNDLSRERIIIRKEDKSYITDEDFKELENLGYISKIEKDDLIIDYTTYMCDDNYYCFDGTAGSLSSLTENLDYGRMPETANEIVVSYNPNYNYFKAEDIIGKEFSIDYSEVNTLDSYIVTGVVYSDRDNYTSKFYLTDEGVRDYSIYVKSMVSNLNIYIENNSGYYYSIYTSPNVQKGTVVVNENSCYNCINKTLNMTRSDIYETITKQYKISGYVDYINYKTYGFENYDGYNSAIILNDKDYEEFNTYSIYQSSVYVDDYDNLDMLEKELNKLGYDTIKIVDTLTKNEGLEVFVVFNNLATIVMIGVLFFITYFVVKLIIKSRNVYFSTIRILGSTKKIARQLLIGELIVVATLAYILNLVLIHTNIFDFSLFVYINEHLTILHYFILYIVIILMSYLISIRFSSKLFKDSVITTLNEEV